MYIYMHAIWVFIKSLQSSEALMVHVRRRLPSMVQVLCSVEGLGFKGFKGLGL